MSQEMILITKRFGSFVIDADIIPLDISKIEERLLQYEAPFNFVNNLLFTKPILNGEGKRVIVQMDHLEGVPIYFHRKQYHFRCRDVVYCLDLMNPTTTIQGWRLNRLRVFISDNKIISNKQEIYPLPLLNIFGTGEVCLGDSARFVRTTDIAKAIYYFINQFWLSDFEDDLMDAIKTSLSARGYFSQLMRKCSSDRDVLFRKVNEFLISHAASKPIKIAELMEGE